MTPQPIPLMTIDELAAYLNVRPATIRAWRLNGTGPTPIRVGGSLRWRQADVDAWITDQQKGV